MNGCWILSNAFSASIEMTCFLSFLLFMWCITLIDLCMLNQPWELGIYPTWSWCMIFLCVVGFGLLIFCWEFLYLYSPKILACNFLFWCCLWFWYQGDGHFIECLRECSLLFHFLEELKKDQYKFFVCLVEFSCEAIWSWTFVCREFFNYTFYFTSSDRSVQMICFFWIQFWWTVCF